MPSRLLQSYGSTRLKYSLWRPEHTVSRLSVLFAQAAVLLELDELERARPRTFLLLQCMLNSSTPMQVWVLRHSRTGCSNSPSDFSFRQPSTTSAGRRSSSSEFSVSRRRSKHSSCIPRRHRSRQKKSRYSLVREGHDHGRLGQEIVCSMPRLHRWKSHGGRVNRWGRNLRVSHSPKDSKGDSKGDAELFF